MPHASRSVLTLLLASAAILLPGCVAPPESAESAASAPPAGGIELPTVAVDAAEMLQGLRAFAEEFPKRNSDGPTHNAARAWLASELEAAGLEVVTDELTADPSPFATPTGVLTGGRLVNVCGILWGERTDELVVAGGHYDVTDGAIHGAYDDGSGTLITVRMAQAFAAAGKPLRTGVFCAFDGEEQGLRGSQHMAEAVIKGEWVIPGNVTAMVNWDMVGIAWPAQSPLVVSVYSPEIRRELENLTLAEGYPEGSIAWRGIRGGSSDFGSFVGIEAPTAFFISAFDEVKMYDVDYPESYPFWHQLDTYDGMVAVAGSEANLVEGFQHVVNVNTGLLARLLYDPTFEPTFASDIEE